ncbi:MAG TPA: hypothetical protein VK171_00695 [Fimbriimonas sp.]|nr:hypothetical protein [Fimbriimonas sp.]
MIYGSWNQGGAVLILVLTATRCANDFWGSNPWLPLQIIPAFVLLAIVVLAIQSAPWHKVFSSLAIILLNSMHAWIVSTGVLLLIDVVAPRYEYDRVFGYGVGLCLLAPAALAYAFFKWIGEALEAKANHSSQIRP